MSEPQAHRTRRRRSREEADRLVKEFEQSGLTRQIFCRQHGLSLATLDNYRRQRACGPGQAQDAAPAAVSAPTVTFVPVELVERSSPHRPTADDGARLHIELAGGRRIAVTAGFDAATLTRLIAVLEQV
jgi:transposase-like protein